MELTRQGLAGKNNVKINLIDGMRDVIRQARQKHIALDIVIAPVHSQYLEVVVAKQLWPRYQAAKAALTQAVAEAEDPSIKLWDFVGFDQFSTEPVPPHGDLVHKMTWFWEPYHFKLALGEKILATVYRHATEFGTQLTIETLSARLDADTRAKDAFYTAHPGEDDRIRAELDKVH